MTLSDAIVAAGMTPPLKIVAGRWLRFPGAGKGQRNRSGWCRLITPTLAIYGDWSSGLSATWKDDAHVDSAETQRRLAEARERERKFATTERVRQEEVAKKASDMIRTAKSDTHPYLARKGFPSLKALVHGNKLLVPMRDSANYRQILNAQEIAEDGTKRFLAGGRARGAIYRIGSIKPRHTVLCEGYATGLSLDAALRLLPGPHAVIVCFSARNIEIVAETFPCAVVAADNDRSGTGEHAARCTGLKWTMPFEVGSDFNDLHINMGLHVVVERLREILMGTS